MELGGKALRKISCLMVISLFCLSSIIPMVNSIYVEKSTDTLENVLDNGPMDSAWPMSCHDLHHTGRSPYNTAHNSGVTKWKYESDVAIEGGIIIDNEGTIYFGGGHNNMVGYLVALKPDGTVKWKQNTNGWIPSGATPAISEDGTIYIGSFGDYLWAFNQNGTFKWNFHCGSSIASSPAIAVDGTIYIGVMGPGGNTGRIFAINPTGTEKWRYDTGDLIVSDPAIADDGTIYIGSFDTYLYAMNPDGTLKWKFKTGDEIHSHPSISDDGIIYFGSHDNYLYAVYPNGTMYWKTNYGGYNYNCATIGHDGTIYATNGNMYALYPNNGSLKWEYDFGEGISVGHSSPAISNDGIIYVGARGNADNRGGYIYAINSDGTLRWRIKISNFNAESSPCIKSDGTVYIGSSYNEGLGDYSGHIWAFGTPEHPNKPSISGPNTGKPGEICEYSIVTIDHQGDNVEYYIDWDDETNSGWIGPYPSGENITVNHIWNTRGTYTMKVRARDSYGHESDWATLEVIMPKTYTFKSVNQLLLKIVKCFPFFEKILNQIIL